jgi:hypothetical protein
MTFPEAVWCALCARYFAPYQRGVKDLPPEYQGRLPASLQSEAEDRWQRRRDRPAEDTGKICYSCLWKVRKRSGHCGKKLRRLSGVAHLHGIELHVSETSPTGYAGVRAMADGRYEASASVQGVKVSIGVYPSLIQAAMAYARHKLESNVSEQAAAEEDGEEDGEQQSTGLVSSRTRGAAQRTSNHTEDEAHEAMEEVEMVEGEDDDEEPQEPQDHALSRHPPRRRTRQSAAVLARIAELGRAGLTVEAIDSALSSEGHTTSTGTPWPARNDGRVVVRALLRAGLQPASDDARVRDYAAEWAVKMMAGTPAQPSVKDEGVVPPMPLDALVKEEELKVPATPEAAAFKEEPPTWPAEACVKVEGC